MSLFIILSRRNCHLLISDGFELLCNVCYWKCFLIVFVVRLHHQALLSCGAKCYFSKLGCQLFLVQCFWKKIESHKFSIFVIILGPWNVALFLRITLELHFKCLTSFWIRLWNLRENYTVHCHQPCTVNGIIL